MPRRDGDPLLLIHGLGLSRRSWKPVLPILTREHDVLPIDVPGFGTTPPLHDRTPTVAALTDAIETELDQTGLESVHVASNSLGGWIALQLARRGRARSAVALSPSGLEAPAERLYVVAMNEMLRARSLVGAPVAALLAANPTSRSVMLGGLHGRPWRVPAHDAATEIKDFATATGFHPTLYSTTGSSAPTGLSEIRIPVRICFGTEDAMLGALTAPRFAAAIPGAQLIPLAGCGHVPMADNPGLIAEAITDLTLVCRARRAG